MVLPGSEGSTVYMAATLVVCEPPPPEPVVVGVEGTVVVPWLGGCCVPGMHWS